MGDDSFVNKGFLAGDVFHHRQKVLLEYSEAFGRCNDLSEQAQLLLVKSPISTTDAAKVASFLFAERTVRGCQAAVRLCEMGLVQEAQVLLRTSLESLFHSSALLVEPEIFQKLGSDNDREDNKYARAMLEHVAESQMSPEDRAFLEELSARENTENYSIFHSAQVSGLVDLYSVQYRGLSTMAGHATFRSLDRTLSLVDGQYVIDMGPSTEQLVFTLSLISNCLNLVVATLKRMSTD